MLISISIAGVTGLFVGWNFPQPQYAKNIQTKIIEVATKIKNKVVK